MDVEICSLDSFSVSLETDAEQRKRLLLEENNRLRRIIEHNKKMAKYWKDLCILFEEEVKKAKERYNIPADDYSYRTSR